jgi:hypothetical protein
MLLLVIKAVDPGLTARGAERAKQDLAMLSLLKIYRVPECMCSI